MENLVVFLVIIIALLGAINIDRELRYKRLLSSYKSIGQALVQCGGINQDHYDKYIKNRK